MSPGVRGARDGAYVAHVWTTYCGCVTRRQGFTTLAGATRYAERESAKEGVKEVTVTRMADAPNPDGLRNWGPRLLVARNGEVVADTTAAA